MAAEFRDEETGNHILRMSHISALLARTIGWDDAQCEMILLASPMHDIGKIGIPDNILLKPGKFEPEEWEIMKTHTTIGGKLLEDDDSNLMRMAREIALSHHENGMAVVILQVLPEMLSLFQDVLLHWQMFMMPSPHSDPTKSMAG